MSDKRNNNSSQEHDMSIMEAVENLTSLADMHKEDHIGITDDNHIVVQAGDELMEIEEFEQSGIHWTSDAGDKQTEELIKDTFSTVLNYVKDFYKKEFTRFYEEKNQKGIHRIMKLVGTASKKLDNYTHLFRGVHKHGVSRTREFKQLDNFYRERVAVEEEGKRPYLIDLAKRVTKENEEEERDSGTEALILRKEKQAFLEVESIKDDNDYELLFMEKEDGSPFYNKALIRNLKLACSFSELLGKEKTENPIILMKRWYDNSICHSAQHILKSIQPYLCEFYQEALKLKEMGVVSSINKAVMSLMMCANPKNCYKNEYSKCCLNYFQDFQYYLREGIHTDEYIKLNGYPPPKSNRFLNSILDIIQILSISLFEHAIEIKNLKHNLDEILEEGKIVFGRKPIKESAKKEKSIWDTFEEDYAIFSRIMQNFPNGPLYHTLHSLEEGIPRAFDTLSQWNLPGIFYKMQIGQNHISCIRLPSPTFQKNVREVEITDEFKSYLKAIQFESAKNKHLIINLQNRNSWKEFKRCYALEQTQLFAEFADSLNVVTLNHDSDFYHQYPPYDTLNESKLFIEQFKEHLMSEDCGFYFPKWIFNLLFSGGFIDGLFKGVHHFFFSNKNVLSVKERQEFIDIAYCFIELKIIDLTQVNSFSLTCKDSIDIGGTVQTQFYAFLNLLSKGKLYEEDINRIYSMTFAMPLVIRERLVAGQRYYRMMNMLKTIDGRIKGIHSTTLQSKLKNNFGNLFDFSFYEMQV